MNKTVLITGAAKRIGRSIATSLAEDGWNIAIHYNNSEKEALDLKNEIEKFGRKAAIIKADLADPEQLKKIIPAANEKLGKLACLINNASIFKNDNISNLSEELWNEHMDVNLKAPLLLSQAFATQLPKNTEGNIINIIDYMVWSLPKNFLSYSISKSALLSLTQMLAIQLAPNIRVNGIGPGNCLPNEFETQEHFDKAISLTPLGKAGDLQEICKTLKYIISSHSMTGQMIALDGGKHLIGADLF